MRHALMAGAILFTFTFAMTGSAQAQELILRGTVETQPATAHETTEAAAPLPLMSYPHPTVSPDGQWGGLLTSLILVFFGLAALIGVLTDIDRSYDVHGSHSHDDAHAGHRHQDAAGHGHH